VCVCVSVRVVVMRTACVWWQETRVSALGAVGTAPWHRWSSLRRLGRP